MSRSATVKDNPIRYSFETIGQHRIRVAQTNPKDAHALPLLVFNGIGSSIETLASLMQQLVDFRVISFDLPGVGASNPTFIPRRYPEFAKLTLDLIDSIGIDRVNIMGISWGGGLAQQFTHDYTSCVKRLVLAATSTGHFMVPPSLPVLMHMATPFRYMSATYFKKIAGTIYGGDFRTDTRLIDRFTRLMSRPSIPGYLNQLYAVTGWTSVLWAHKLRQPTLIMAGKDDPLISMANAHLLNFLIPDSRIVTFDCGHLFLLTRQQQSVSELKRFLSHDCG